MLVKQTGFSGQVCTQKPGAAHHQYRHQQQVAHSLQDVLQLGLGLGAGLRYLTAIGPIRVDIGVPLNPEPRCPCLLLLDVSALLRARPTPCHVRPAPSPGRVGPRPAG